MTDILFEDDDVESALESYHDADDRRRMLDDDHNGPSSQLAFLLGGFAMRKCQSFEGYSLCAKYNPSARQYRVSVEVASARLQKSEYEQSLHHIERYAAQQLSENMLSDQFESDDFESEESYDYTHDDGYEYDSGYDSEYASASKYDGDDSNVVQFAKCLVILQCQSVLSVIVLLCGCS